MIKVVLNEDESSVFQVEIGGINFGCFCDVSGELVWFPKRTELLSSEELYAIGQALYKANILNAEM